MNQIPAHLFTLMAYRVAADVLAQMHPVSIGNDAEMLRCQPRQVFDVVAEADIDIKVLIHWSLDAVGRADDTMLIAFTDGCSCLRRILVNVSNMELPILNWFHITMRLQHLKQTASSLSAKDPAQGVAKAMIVEAVERLHWRPRRMKISWINNDA